MLLRRPLQTLTLPPFLLRRLSAAAEALVSPADPHHADPLSPPYDYLPGHPRPDAKHDEVILAVPRASSGRHVAAKERKAGRVPAIVFEQENGQEGGNKRLVSVPSKQIRKLVDHLGRSFFLSRLFRIQVWSEHAGQGDLVESVRVLPRKVHLHAGTDEPLNVTFMRAPSSALLKIDVPLMFIGDDASPGLRKGAYFNTIKRTVKFLCPADIVPPYIEVDLSELDVGQKLLMRDLKVHPALKLLQSPDQPICSIIGSRAPEQKKTK
ncbi:uncharacterized protein LOC133915149 [Phragmites australis]|uniref:uncharacterized protein LOC133915149 n=1 Tax=Phragmites australis TaxID=29695 RepID=UPI002D77334A|nr:uncharacterized protein LOC133915149 [Phragmites australis]